MIVFNRRSRGRNSSVGSAWARCPQRRGFDPPLGTFSGRGDFSLGVNMGSNSIPPKTPSDESINRGLVCAHMHFIARTQKILTFMSLTGECRQQKHTQHAPSTKTECDYLNGWIKKRSHTQKSHRKKKRKKIRRSLFCIPFIRLSRSPHIGLKTYFQGI